MDEEIENIDATEVIEEEGDEDMNEFDDEEEEEEEEDEFDDEDEDDEPEDLSSPLIAAVVAGDLTTVQGLLDAGADKNETTNYGCSAVWHAASQGYLNIMQLLL